MTTKQKAEELARDAGYNVTSRMFNDFTPGQRQYVSGLVHQTLRSTIPLVLLLEAVEALKAAQQWIDVDSNNGCDCGVTEHCTYCSKGEAVSAKIETALTALRDKAVE